MFSSRSSARSAERQLPELAYRGPGGPPTARVAPTHPPRGPVAGRPPSSRSSLVYPRVGRGSEHGEQRLVRKNGQRPSRAPERPSQWQQSGNKANPIRELGVSRRRPAGLPHGGSHQRSCGSARPLPGGPAGRSALSLDLQGPDAAASTACLSPSGSIISPPRARLFRTVGFGLQDVLGLAVQVLCHAAGPIAARTSAAARSPLRTAASILHCDV